MPPQNDVYNLIKDMANSEVKKMLIVEDDATLLKALREKFLKEGFNVFVAKDGAVGLQMALAERPEIVLLDIVMPVMDGLTLMKRLRADAWGKDVPIILLTNLNSAEDVATALENKVFDYLVKSDWSLADVAKKVHERLNQLA